MKMQAALHAPAIYFRDSSPPGRSVVVIMASAGDRGQTAMRAANSVVHLERPSRLRRPPGFQSRTKICSGHHGPRPPSRTVLCATADDYKFTIRN